jgi:2,3,4,5-tetrahydropyridine-2-carboxylate N-succinyltransferase
MFGGCAPHQRIHRKLPELIFNTGEPMTQQLQQIIDNAWEDRANLSPKAAPKEVIDAVEEAIVGLNNGSLRVATREGVGQWTTHQWLKKAVLLSFRLNDNEPMHAGDLVFYDKV